MGTTKVFMYSPTSFADYPINEMIELLNELGSKNTIKTSSGLTSSFDDGEIIVNGFCSCQFKILKSKDALIPAYLIRLQKILHLLKDHSILFSDKVNISLDSKRKFPEEGLIYSIIKSLNQSNWVSTTLHLTVKKPRNLDNISKKIFEFSTSLGWLPVYSYRDTEETVIYKNDQKYKEKTYSLTIKLRKKTLN